VMSPIRHVIIGRVINDTLPTHCSRPLPSIFSRGISIDLVVAVLHRALFGKWQSGADGPQDSFLMLDFFGMALHTMSSLPWVSHA
jgi:hypothetical protein